MSEREGLVVSLWMRVGGYLGRSTSDGYLEYSQGGPWGWGGVTQASLGLLGLSK